MEYMRANHGPPKLLIGHSLGGAAALATAGRVHRTMTSETVIRSRLA